MIQVDRYTLEPPTIFNPPEDTVTLDLTLVQHISFKQYYYGDHADPCPGCQATWIKDGPRLNSATMTHTDDCIYLNWVTVLGPED